MEIVPGTRLAKVAKASRVTINTSHRYHVTELGEGLVVTARSDDGVIEAFEHKTLPVTGFQFHPERSFPVHPNHLDMADFASYFATFRKHLMVKNGTPVHFELGRSIVAPCGSLICRVLYVKEGSYRQFAIIDGSMTELIRPALYKAFHRVENLSSQEPEEVYDVVGPVCESSDVFAKSYSMDKCHRGDFIAIRSAGAYGEAMASQYNLHALPSSYYHK
jgi:hypothetical protein